MRLALPFGSFGAAIQWVWRRQTPCIPKVSGFHHFFAKTFGNRQKILYLCKTNLKRE
jgi:hypothetical protein